MEKRRTSSTIAKPTKNTSSPRAGAVQELSPALEQLPFPDYNPLLGDALPSLSQPLSPVPVSEMNEQVTTQVHPTKTRQLTNDTPETPLPVEKMAALTQQHLPVRM